MTQIEWPKPLLKGPSTHRLALLNNHEWYWLKVGSEAEWGLIILYFEQRSLKGKFFLEKLRIFTSWYLGRPPTLKQRCPQLQSQGQQGRHESSTTDLWRVIEDSRQEESRERFKVLSLAKGHLMRSWQDPRENFSKLIKLLYKLLWEDKMQADKKGNI